MIGGEGLTPAVSKEIDHALNAHGLIKVRVFSDDRAARAGAHHHHGGAHHQAPAPASPTSRNIAMKSRFTDLLDDTSDACPAWSVRLGSWAVRAQL